MRILLATDGSVFSREAIKSMADRQFPSGTEMHIISAYERPSLIMASRYPTAENADTYARLDATARESAKDAVDDAIKILKEKHSDLLISGTAINGSPKEVILKEAEEFDADLIVVGSQGKGAIPRFLLGSVSQSVALHAPCSVAIIRRKETTKAI